MGKQPKEPNLDQLVEAMTGKGRLSGSGDMTSLDAHKQHSRKIVRGLLRWAYARSEDGQLWERLGDIASDAANACLPCSSTTAARWLQQFMRPGAPYRLVEVLVDVHDEYGIARRPWGSIVIPIRKELERIRLRWE